MTRERRETRELDIGGLEGSPRTDVLDAYDELCAACRQPRAVVYSPLESGGTGQLRYARGGAYAYVCVDRYGPADYRVAFAEVRDTSGPWETEREAAEYAALACGYTLVDKRCGRCDDGIDEEG